MAGLDAYTEDDGTGTPYGVADVPPINPAQYMSGMPPQVVNPEVNAQMSGVVSGLSNDMLSDYHKAHDDSQNRRGALDSAVNDAANSYMQGYDPNAYDAQAWAQAGIGAATPTLSALESLNRAVAGYSGVKLKQRADFGERLAQQKQLQMQYLQQQQKQDDSTQSENAKNLIQLYKDGLVTKGTMMNALGQRYKIIPNVGMVDTWKLMQGANPKEAVVVNMPQVRTGELMSKINEQVAAELAQDKTFHWTNLDDYNREFQRRVASRVGAVNSATGGIFQSLLAQDPNVGSPPVLQQPMAPGKVGGPLPAGTIEEAPVSSAAPNITTVNPGQPVSGMFDFTKNTPAELHAQVDKTPDLSPEQKTQFHAMIDQGAQDNAQIPAGPWTGYVRPQVQTAKPLPSGMYDKSAQEQQIEQGKQAEKNAEDAYQKVSDKAGSAMNWYDTVRTMKSMPLEGVGSFAGIRQGVGNMLSTFGMPNADLAKEATNLSSLNSLIMQGIQQRLSTQNGVQARDDALREQQSFAQITDPKRTFKALIAQAEAKSLRMVEQQQFYQSWKAQNGTYTGADAAWNRYIKDTPLFTNYAGQPMYQNQFTDKFMELNKGNFDKQGLTEAQRYDIATKQWRAIAKGRK
jgi:hypothetical protein